MSFHTGQTFVFGEQPSATKWQYIWDNDYALADGSGIEDDAIVNRHILAGELKTHKIDNDYKFFAYRSSAQSTVNGSAKVNFNAELYDSGSNYDAATNFRFTAPIAGFYFFFANVAENTGGSGTDMGVKLYKNGVEYIRGNNMKGVQFPFCMLVCELQAAANDYFELYVQETAVVALFTGSSPLYTYFGGSLRSLS